MSTKPFVLSISALLVAVASAAPPSRTDPLLVQIKDDLARYGTFKAHWPGSAFPNQYQLLKVVQIDSHGISLVKRLAYSETDPLWNKAEKWSSTWSEFGRVDVVSPSGGPGGPFIGLRTERPGLHGPYYLFFSFTVPDREEVAKLGDELRQAAAKYGMR